MLMGMMGISSVFLSSFSYGTAANVLPAVSQVTAGVVSDFFKNLFLHPEKHFVPVAILCGAVVAACVGIAFLAKLVYEKYCPEYE